MNVTSPDSLEPPKALSNEDTLLLNFLAALKNSYLTEQQAVDKLTEFTAKSMQGLSALSTHQQQLALLNYAQTISK